MLAHSPLLNPVIGAFDERLHIQPRAEDNCLGAALLADLLGVSPPDITILVYGAGGAVMVHELWLNRVALQIQVPVAAKVCQGVVDGEARASLDCESHKDLLCTSVRDSVRETTEWCPSPMYHAGAFWKVLQGFYRLLVLLGSDGLVILNQVPSVVVLGKNFAAVTGPNDVPVVAVRGVLAVRERDARELANTLCKVDHLASQANIPICIILKDEHRCKIVLNNTVGEID